MLQCKPQIIISSSFLVCTPLSRTGTSKHVQIATFQYQDPNHTSKVLHEPRISFRHKLLVGCSWQCTKGKQQFWNGTFCRTLSCECRLHPLPCHVLYPVWSLQRRRSPDSFCYKILLNKWECLWTEFLFRSWSVWDHHGGEHTVCGLWANLDPCFKKCVCHDADVCPIFKWSAGG